MTPSAPGSPSAAGSPPATSLRPALLRMLGASAFFALMATFVGAAHRHDPSLSTVVASAVRSSVNLLVLVAISIRAPSRLWGDRRGALWLRGVLGAASLLTYFGALSAVGIGEAAFLNNTSTIWVAVLAPFFLAEKTSPKTWIAIAGSLVGLALLAHPRTASVAAGTTVVTRDLTGRILGLTSGMCAAGAYLSVRRASATNGPTTIVFYFTLISTLVCVAILLYRGEPITIDLTTLALLSAGGICATIAQVWMTRAYQLGPAAPLAASGAAGPLFALLLGWAVLAQAPDGRALVGMAILLLAAVVLPFLSSR